MIYLLRHGETSWNTAGRFQGHKDSALTRRGIEQADRMAVRLAEELTRTNGKFEARVSPLGRARETADRIAQLTALNFSDDLRLIEVTLGSWDGMTLYEIDTEYPGALTGSDAFDWYFRSPDGETFDDACKRVESWLSEVSSPTVAVSHGLTSRLLRGIYLGLSRREMLELPVPQNGFYRLCDRRSEFIDWSAENSQRQKAASAKWGSD
jgi:broad specificity phosphatase PhoE